MYYDFQERRSPRIEPWFGFQLNALAKRPGSLVRVRVGARVRARVGLMAVVQPLSLVYRSL